MAVLGLCALAMFVYLAPLSHASDSAPEQYYTRARVASVECWFDPHCWAAPTATKTGRDPTRVEPPPEPLPRQTRPPDRSKRKARTASVRSGDTMKASTQKQPMEEMVPLTCVDDDRLLSTAVGKPISCFVVKEADMCDVLHGTPAENACGCSCG